MDAAQVVPRDVERHGSLQIVEFLAEGIDQPREPAHVHPKIQVRPFDMAGANVLKIGIAADWVWDRLDNFGRAVPVRSSVIGLTVQLDELREVNISTEAFLDCSNVRLECVGSNLYPAS